MECEGELWCRSGSDGMCEVRVLAVEVRVVVLAALRVGEVRSAGKCRPIVRVLAVEVPLGDGVVLPWVHEAGVVVGGEDAGGVERCRAEWGLEDGGSVGAC